MKKLVLFTLLFVLYSVSINSKPLDNIKAADWLKEKFEKGKVPPFSFVYGGKSSDSFITSWEYKAEKQKSTEDNVEKMLYTYSDKQSGLVVKCFVTWFSDYNAAEYVLRFINTSSQNTPIIEKTCIVDNSFSYKTGGQFILNRLQGSNASVSDFQVFEDEMQVGKSIYMTPNGGRSSDETAFPFFNIESPAHQGIIVAVGWTGKWFADVVQKDEKTVSLKTGMERMHLTLYPKEEIRTPSICLFFWKGDDKMIGHNKFRRFILAHHTRKINGSIPQMPLSGPFELDEAPSPCSVHSCLTETAAIAHIKRYQFFKLKPDLYWIDAGWYTGCGLDKEDGGWGTNVGNWSVDKEKFPNGLKPISDAAHAAGAKFMVWFEPERVHKGTEWHKEHPEWMLSKPISHTYLYDLGNTEARLWLTDFMTNFFKKEGVDYYRQDFNFDPMTYWKVNDKPDRVGILEAKHIEGLYAFWDSLLVRFPNLVIDNCASGGRRLDIETTSRSTPFWRTDLEQNATGSQCHTYGLNLYLPLSGTGLYKTGNYYFWSCISSLAVINWSISGSNNETVFMYQKYIEDFKRLREYYLADYYPLTPPEEHYINDGFWMAYQFNRPEKNDGVVFAFKRPRCQDDSIHVQLKGLSADSKYELFYEGLSLKLVKQGKELMDGLDIVIQDKPGAVLIDYKKIDN